MTIRQISEMVRNKNPVTLTEDTPVQEACRWMTKHAVGAVLVTDAERRLVGILTGRDIVGRVAGECRDLHTRRWPR